MRESGDKRSGRVLVVGSVNVDFVVVVNRLPGPGETVGGGEFARYWGGKGANQAVAASRYGAKVEFVGAVGEDGFGEEALEVLNREGVRTRDVARHKGFPTGVAFIVVDGQGQNQIAVAPGANATADASRLTSLLRGSPPGVLLTCFEVPEATVVRAIAAAQDAGWTMIVNPAPANPLPPEFQCTQAILTPNEQELTAITGIDNVETAARLLVREVTEAPVVVTLGEEGALVVRETEVIHIPPPRVSVRDTTGAGDTFNGVFAAAIAEGRPLTEAARLGVAAASFSVEAAGAREGILTGPELRRRLDLRSVTPET